jgi:hypothetical protein
MKAETIIVKGQVLNQGGQRISTLGDDIKKAINGFLSSNPGISIEKIVPQVNLPSAALGGEAFFLILYSGKGK